MTKRRPTRKQIMKRKSLLWKTTKSELLTVIAEEAYHVNLKII